MNKKNTLALIIDLVIAAATVFFVYRIRFGGVIPDTHGLTFILMMTAALPYVLFGLFMGNYSKRSVIDLETAGNLFVASLGVHILYFAALMVIRIYIRDLEFSTPILVLFAFLIPFFSLLTHIILERITSNKDKKPAIILVGFRSKDENSVKKYLKTMKQHYKIAGVTGDPLGEFKVFPGDREIFSLLEQLNPEAILFCPGADPLLIEELVLSRSLFTTSLLFTPELFDEISKWGKARPVAGLPLFELDIHPIRGFSKLFQRILDIIIALTGLVLFFPFGLIIALLILAESPGNVFFTQVRTGMYGKPFLLIKFRTMVKGAEKNGPQWTEKHDPRITKIGGVLRRLSLDEVPQLINILLGQMSVVGPRPERPFFIEKHPVLKGARLLVKPGITGLAQINGRYDLTPEEKSAFDMQFINNFSIFLYFSIIFRTIFIILGGKGVR